MDWQKSVAFFSGLELFTLKCSNEEGRVLELFLLCLEIFCFYFLTVRHILVQICVCVRLFIWGRQILCILKRVKIFPKQSLSQKENNSQLESLLVRHYTTMWECMFIWKMVGGGGDRRIKTGNVKCGSSVFSLWLGHCSHDQNHNDFNSVSYM